MSIEGETWKVESWQNWCPLGCGWIEDLFHTQTEANKMLVLHLTDFHKVKNDRIKVIDQVSEMLKPEVLEREPK